MSTPRFPSSRPSPAAPLVCRLCAHAHQPVPLAPGQRALCRRCGALLAKPSRFGRDAALAFTLAGFALAIPAVILPFVTVGKLGQQRVGFLSTGTDALWDGGMSVLSVWVLLCGTLVPLLLLGTLAALLARPRFGWPPATRRALARAAHVLEHWSMPEVHVLAVLVALTKLGTLVDVAVEPGFWCYAAMSLMILAAWRSFEFGTPASPNAAEPHAASTT